MKSRTPEIRSAYGPRSRLVKETPGESMAKQSFRDECDINTIMAKYQKSGIVTHLAAHQGRYGDFIDAPTYHQAMNAIVAAQDAFMSLPAAIRARFDNDPANFLDFAQDPENIDELREMGLAHPASDEVPEKPEENALPAGEPDSSAASPEGA